MIETSQFMRKMILKLSTLVFLQKQIALSDLQPNYPSREKVTMAKIKMLEN